MTRSALQQELHVVSRCSRRSSSSFGHVMASDFAIAASFTAARAVRIPATRARARLSLGSRAGANAAAQTLGPRAAGKPHLPAALLRGGRSDGGDSGRERPPVLRR